MIYDLSLLKTKECSIHIPFKYTYRVFTFYINISASDPYHWPGSESGSGSASGNVDLDPGTKKNCGDKLAYKSTKIIKIYIFF